MQSRCLRSLLVLCLVGCLSCSTNSTKKTGEQAVEKEGQGQELAKTETPSPSVSQDAAVDAPAKEGTAERGPMSEPPPLELVCQKHEDCVVLPGVCQHPSPIRKEFADEARARIQKHANVASCGPPSIRVEDTTPACIRGACSYRIGKPPHLACKFDKDCEEVSGLCEMPTAVRSTQKNKFEELLMAMKTRMDCGPPSRVSQLKHQVSCSQGLCVALPVR